MEVFRWIKSLQNKFHSEKLISV